MHRAILFDLGNTLVHFDFVYGYRALEGLCPYTAEEIPVRLRQTDLVERFEAGGVEPHDFHRQLAEILQFDISYERFCEIWNSIFRQELAPESLLAGLHKRYRMVLVSNTNPIHIETIKRNYAHLLRHFDRLVLSHEVKAVKPDPVIYQAAIEAAECAPGECFYTDDIEAFIEGGRRAGLDAVRFESAGQLEAALRFRGIDWA